MPARSRRTALVLTLATLTSLSAFSFHRSAFPATPAPVPTTAPATAPSAQEIDRLIQQLASPDFPTRDNADQRLRQIGWPAMATLFIARADAKDPEASSRLDSIIEGICYNTNGLSADDAKLVAEYRAFQASRPTGGLTPAAGGGGFGGGGPSGFGGGPLGGEFVAGGAADSNRTGTDPFGGQSRITMQNQSPDVVLVINRALALLKNQRLADPFSGATLVLAQSDYFRRLSRDPDSAEYAWTVATVASFAEQVEALRQTKVSLEPVIQAMSRSSIFAPPPPNSFGASVAPDRINALRLAVAVARNDVRAILDLASNSRYQDVVVQYLAQRQQWAAVAELPIQDNSTLLAPFIHAAAFQFAGDAAKSQEWLRQSVARETRVYADGILARPVLLGNFDLPIRTARALGYDVEAADMLLAQRRYQEALSLYEKSETKKDRNGTDWEYHFVADLMRLNQTERARQIIAKFDGMISTKPDPSVIRILNAADFRLARPILIVDRAQRLAKTDSDSWVLRSPFPNESPMDNWFQILGTMRPTVQDVATLIKLHDNNLVTADLMTIADINWDDPTPLLDATCLLEMRGDHAAAADTLVKYFQRAKFTTKRQFDRTYPEQDHYFRILSLRNWQLSRQLVNALHARLPQEPVWTCFTGLCYEKSGDAQNGKALISEALARVQGDTVRCLFLARALYLIGEPDRAAPLAQAIFDSGNSLFSSDGMDELLAHIESDRGHYAQALAYLRGAIIQRARRVEYPQGYYPLAHFNLYLESRQALSISNAGMALERAQALVLADPEDLTLTLQLIQAFKDAHLPDQAQSLTTLNRSLLETILKDFPNSHLHHYLIAQLDTKTGFTTPQTATHLQKAQQLAPTNPLYKIPQ